MVELPAATFSFAGIQPAHLLAEVGGQVVQAFHQRARHLVQQLALAGGVSRRPLELQQAHAQFRSSACSCRVTAGWLR